MDWGHFFYTSSGNIRPTNIFIWRQGRVAEKKAYSNKVCSGPFVQDEKGHGHILFCVRRMVVRWYWKLPYSKTWKTKCSGTRRLRTTLYFKTRFWPPLGRTPWLKYTGAGKTPGQFIIFCWKPIVYGFYDRLSLAPARDPPNPAKDPLAPINILPGPAKVLLAPANISLAPLKNLLLYQNNGFGKVIQQNWTASVQR